MRITNRVLFPKATKLLIDDAYKNYREVIRTIAEDAGKDVKACLAYAEGGTKLTRKYNSFNSWKVWYAANGKKRRGQDRMYKLFNLQY